MTAQQPETAGTLTYDEVLVGLANNPALPLALLERFIAVADEELCDILASRDSLTPAQVAMLAKRGARYRLIWEGKVPIGDVPRDDPQAMLAALRRDDAPPSWAAELATSADAKVRRDLPELVPDRVDVMSTLVDDPDMDVVSEVALWATGLPEGDMRRLYSRPDCDVRDALARNEHTPADILAELLASAGSPAVEVCGNCRPQPSAAPRVWGGGHDAAAWVIRTAALQNPATPVGNMTDFLTSEEPWVRAALAERTDLAEDLYRQLAVDPDRMVRGAVAKNSAIAAPLRRQLAGDGDLWVRQCLCENPVIPLDLLVELAAEVRHGVGPLPRVAAASLEELRSLAASPVAQVRSLAASYQDLPVGLLTALVGDADAGVVTRVLADPRVTAQQLRTVLHRHGMRVMSKVARHPNCPADVLDHVAKSGKRAQPAWLREVARNPAAPASALRESLDAPSARRWAAQHPNLPGDIVASLLDDPEWTVRAAAAANPALPVVVMEGLLRPGPGAPLRRP